MAERTPWEGGYVGITGLGLGGSSVHLIIKSPDDIVPAERAHVAKTATRLVTCAGRTKDGVEVTLAEMLQYPESVEMQSLLETSVGNLPPTSHPYRGFALLNAAANRQTVEVQ